MLNLSHNTKKRMWIALTVIVLLVGVKCCWVKCSTSGHGSFEGEKEEIIHRANYLISKVATSPQKLMDEMPSGIGEQFQGEWALYTCSMTAAALANIAQIYPENKELSIKYINQIIDIAKSQEIREYDRVRWNENPLGSLNGNRSHVSYLSHLAWMIGNYKKIGGNDKYDELYDSLCEAMNRRMLQRPSLCLPTYPEEYIYVPDMLVAIVALEDYAKLKHGTYQSTVDKWLHKAKTEWIDKETGLLASFLNEKDDSVEIVYPIKGSYSALNCYYLSLVDRDFAKEQYECLKKNFKRTFPFDGISEYHDRLCWLGMDIDAGPIIMNLSPSGTAFAIGCATSHGDMEFRSQLLKTGEIAGSTVIWFESSHYLLANLALVGEAIVLAMRTTVQK